MLPSAESRVDKGIAFLDKNVEDWVDKIEVKDLDIGNSCRCVIGQVIPTSDTVYSFHKKCRVLSIPLSELQELGFDAHDDAVLIMDDYIHLTNEWKKRITERKNACPT